MVPDAYYKSIYEINYKKLKRIGYKNLFFDVDNTLLSYKENELSDKCINLIEFLKKDFNIIVISNSKSNRVLGIVSKLHINSYYRAMKPLKKTYKKILKKYNLDESIFIGDQFMTDVIGAKRNGFKVILVDKISNIEPVYTKFWRFFERKLLKKYNKNGLFKVNRYYDDIK